MAMGDAPEEEQIVVLGGANATLPGSQPFPCRECGKTCYVSSASNLALIVEGKAQVECWDCAVPGIAAGEPIHASLDTLSAVAKQIGYDITEAGIQEAAKLLSARRLWAQQHPDRLPCSYMTEVADNLQECPNPGAWRPRIVLNARQGQVAFLVMEAQLCDAHHRSSAPLLDALLNDQVWDYLVKNLPAGTPRPVRHLSKLEWLEV